MHDRRLCLVHIDPVAYMNFIRPCRHNAGTQEIPLAPARAQQVPALRISYADQRKYLPDAPPDVWQVANQQVLLCVVGGEAAVDELSILVSKA